MARLTYTGCVYADPAHDASQAGPRDLTKDELQAMRLAGLPVRIEHGSRALAGTVRASKTDPESGYTTVELELDDAVAGHAAAELIDRGVIAQLSLRHDVYSDGRKVPVEVSLVNEGARPHTVIFRTDKTHDEAVRDYVSRVPVAASRYDQRASNGRFTVMEATPPAAPAAPPPPAAAAAPAAATPVAVPAAAPDAADPDQPAAKRQALTLTERVDRIAATMDDEKRAELFETLTHMAAERKAAVEKATALERENAGLSARYSATKDNTNSMARQLVQVRGLRPLRPPGVTPRKRVRTHVLSHPPSLAPPFCLGVRAQTGVERRVPPVRAQRGA